QEAAQRGPIDTAAGGMRRGNVDGVSRPGGEAETDELRAHRVQAVRLRIEGEPPRRPQLPRQLRDRRLVRGYAVARRQRDLGEVDVDLERSVKQRALVRALALDSRHNPGLAGRSTGLESSLDVGEIIDGKLLPHDDL